MSLVRANAKIRARIYPLAIRNICVMEVLTNGFRSFGCEWMHLLCYFPSRVCNLVVCRKKCPCFELLIWKFLLWRVLFKYLWNVCFCFKMLRSKNFATHSEVLFLIFSEKKQMCIVKFESLTQLLCYKRHSGVFLPKQEINFCLIYTLTHYICTTTPFYRTTSVSILMLNIDPQTEYVCWLV